MSLLNILVSEANSNNLNYNFNSDISLCSLAIIDSKYRLGCYQECLDLIQLYRLNNYYQANKALPELLRGWCCHILSKHGHVEEIANNFLKSKFYHDDPEVVASFLFLLGKTKYTLNKYNESRQHFNDSLALFRYAGNKHHSCAVLGAPTPAFPVHRCAD